MVLKYFLFAVALLFMSCDNIARDNPNDPGSDKYQGWQILEPPLSSSSVAEASSSSVAKSSSSVLSSSSAVVSSSSSVVFSSGSKPSSSSSAQLSSSSAAKSSSSGALFSSSSMPSSNSNAPPSSSSIAPSSSSAAVPSSSSKPSSSSSVLPSSSSGLCAGFVDGTERMHYEKMKPQFCDKRDGKKYVYVTIGNQTWMAENLNYNASYSKCGNGDSLSDANTTICDTYGRLYFGGGEYSANCPKDWHLPSQAEWETLKDFVGTNAGKKLKAKEGWDSGGNGDDKFGFSALPGGYGSYSSVGRLIFQSVGIRGYWWGKFAGGSYSAGAGISNTDDNIILAGYSTSFMYSVRCLQD